MKTTEGKSSSSSAAGVSPAPPLMAAWRLLLLEGRGWSVPKILSFVEAARELWRALESPGGTGAGTPSSAGALVDGVHSIEDPPPGGDHDPRVIALVEAIRAAPSFGWAENSDELHDWWNGRVAPALMALVRESSSGSSDVRGGR